MWPRSEPELASSIQQLWQWRLALPRSRKGSLLLDGGAQAGERLAQIFVFDLRQTGSDAGGGVGVERRRRRYRLAPAQRCLAQGEAADRMPAEEAIDPFEDHRRQMLDLKCGGTFNS